MAEEPAAGAALDLSAASRSLAAFTTGPVAQAGDAIGATFDRAAARIGAALARAAGQGEDGFRRLAKTALQELARVALDRVLPSSAAPAAQTSTGASVAREVASSVVVNFHMGAGADADSVRRSQAQIAAQVARAAAYGRRNL